MTTLQNIMLAPMKVRRALRARDAEKTARAPLLERVGLREKAGQTIRPISSGGQQQRRGHRRAAPLGHAGRRSCSSTSRRPPLDPEMINEVLDVMTALARRGHDDDVRHARDGVRPPRRPPRSSSWTRGRWSRRGTPPGVLRRAEVGPAAKQFPVQDFSLTDGGSMKNVRSPLFFGAGARPSHRRRRRSPSRTRWRRSNPPGGPSPSGTRTGSPGRSPYINKNNEWVGFLHRPRRRC